MNLKIAEPCLESWEAMTPNAEGKYCAVCEKTVHDFTGKPKEELLAFLLCCEQKPCIRMLSSQEHFTEVALNATARKLLASGIKVPAAAFAWALLFATGCQEQGTTPADVQSELPVVEAREMAKSPVAGGPHYLTNLEVPTPVIPKMGFTPPNSSSAAPPRKTSKIPRSQGDRMFRNTPRGQSGKDHFRTSNLHSNRRGWGWSLIIADRSYGDGTAAAPRDRYA